MIYRVKQVLKYLAGTDIAGRTMAVYPDDTFIVSYPRSGNTWTRFLIANLLHPEEPATFFNIERWVRDSEAQSSRYLKRVPRPRVIKSHQYFDHRFKRIVYIVRDPRDVALSYYDFQRKYRQIHDEYPLTRYVSDFVAGRLSSASWGTWRENVGSWISARGGQSGFLLLRSDTTSKTQRPSSASARHCWMAGGLRAASRDCGLSMPQDELIQKFASYKLIRNVLEPHRGHGSGCKFGKGPSLLWPRDWLVRCLIRTWVRRTVRSRSSLLQNPRLRPALTPT